MIIQTSIPSNREGFGECVSIKRIHIFIIELHDTEMYL